MKPYGKHEWAIIDGRSTCVNCGALIEYTGPLCGKKRGSKSRFKEARSKLNLLRELNAKIDRLCLMLETFLDSEPNLTQAELKKILVEIEKNALKNTRNI